MPGRIIVIDNVLANQSILKNRLESEYYEVEQCKDAKSGWLAVLKDNPDAVLVNCTLPDANGYALCAKIKSHPEAGHVPVILIATSAPEVSWSKAYSSFADDIHCLPQDLSILVPRLQSLTRAKANLDELRLRNQTSEDLGLSEPQSYLAAVSLRRVNVALIGGSASQRGVIAADLGDILAAEVTDLGDDYAVAQTCKADTLLVIDDTPDGGAPLRLMARLRSRRDGRFLSLMYINLAGGLGPNLCERALSMGAIDAVCGPIDPHALAGRVRAVNNHAMLANMLRENMSNTLRLAMTDPLTGLYNRRYARQYLAKAMDRAQSAGRNLFVMMMDLDNFKSINDRFGHPAGDKVLKAVAERLQSNLRGVDLVARIGGEEFLVVITDMPTDRALSIAERIRSVVSYTKVMVEGGTALIPVTASIGLALADATLKDGDAVIAAADRALYTSKQMGRDRVTFGDVAA